MISIPTKTRLLTAADFESDLPPPGSSDKRYSQDFLDRVRAISNPKTPARD
jgi:hypothetical protein